MSSYREYAKEDTKRKQKQRREKPDYEYSHHIEQKVKRLARKNKIDKYRRYDPEDF